MSPPPGALPSPYTTLFRSVLGSTSVTAMVKVCAVVGPAPSEAWTVMVWLVASSKLSSAALATVTTPVVARLEEHTSALQLHGDVVCRLLLEIENPVMHTAV